MKNVPASRHSKARTKKGLVTKVALGLLAVSGGLVALAVAPGLGVALKLIDPNPRKAMDKLERALRNLIEDDAVEVRGEGEKRKYRIAPPGEQKLARLEFAEYQTAKPQKWDGKWWVVCFDIPETEKYSRTLFQTKLSSLGFYRLQNSIFIYPYTCPGLIPLAHKAFGLHKCLRVLVAEHVDNELHLLHFFRLKH